MPSATTVRVKCRFCGVEMWAQSDNGAPECEECGDLAAQACRESWEVEETLHPLTEWEWWETA